MKQKTYFKMKFKSYLMFFFLMEMYSAAQLSTVELAATGTGPNKKLLHSHVNPRQAPSPDPNKWNYIISKNPAQKVRVLFDTGSFQMWLFSNRYDNCDPNWPTIHSKHNLYDYNISSTYVDYKDSRPQVMTYLDEWVFGFKARDVVTVMGVEMNKTFLEVTKGSKVLTDTKFDGVVGLQYDPKYGNSISKSCVETDGKSIFSFYYPKQKRHSGGGGGIFTLCGSNRGQYRPHTSHTIKTIVPGTWIIPLHSVVLHDNRGNFKLVSHDTKIQIQTDLFKILAPEEIFNELYDLLNPYFPGGQVEPEFDCKNMPPFPSLTFNIEGKDYVLTGSDYTRGIENMETRCKLDFDISPSDYWSVGDGFISKYHTIFDMVNHTITLSESIQYSY